MIKTVNNTLKQDKEKYQIPKKVQDIIPVRTIYPDGIFLSGKGKYSKTFRFRDINYAVASRSDKDMMFLEYSELLNSFDSGATTKITINNRRLNRLDFEDQILIDMKNDGLNEYREEYNRILLDKATGSNAIVQDKYVTVSVSKKNIDDARTYFARIGADLVAHFARLGSQCTELDSEERLRIIYDFFRTGEETYFNFDMKDHMKKGHSFADYICPDSYENHDSYFRIGNRYGRVLLLRDYASYIKDSMVAELTDINRNLMLSIDVIPVPTDEAVREVENRLLGVETNITNWQRKQNMNNNYRQLKETSDRLCREHGLSIVEEPKGRGKSYNHYQMEAAGMPTRYNAAKEALDDAIERSCNMQELSANLRSMGYQFSFAPNRKYWTITLPGWKKPIRTYRLGEEYSREAIEQRVFNNGSEARTLRIREGYKKAPQYTLRRRVDKIMGRTGLEKLYLRYCYELGYLPRYRQNSSKVHSLLKDELLRCDMYSEEAKLLSREKITTREQLTVHRQKLEARIESLEESRYQLRLNVKRKVPEEEKSLCKGRIADISKELKELRHELKLVKDIEARSPAMEEKLKEIEKERHKEVQR